MNWKLIVATSLYIICLNTLFCEAGLGRHAFMARYPRIYLFPSQTDDPNNCARI